MLLADDHSVAIWLAKSAIELVSVWNPSKEIGFWNYNLYPQKYTYKNDWTSLNGFFFNDS